VRSKGKREKGKKEKGKRAKGKGEVKGTEFEVELLGAVRLVPDLALTFAF
jgi:hypothetical protein